MKANPKPVEKSFKATLERMQGNLGWVIIRLPFNVEKVWGVRGRATRRGFVLSQTSKSAKLSFQWN